MKDRSLCLIAILPEASVTEQIRSLQQEITTQFGPKRALSVPVHITLEAPFRVAEERVAELSEVLRGFFSGRPKMILNLRDFGSFRQDTFFVSVEPNLALLETQLQLSALLRSEVEFIKEKPRFIGYHPHVTLANRDVTPEAFMRIDKEFRGRKFHARFAVHKVELLRHDGKLWQAYADFDLVPA